MNMKRKPASQGSSRRRRAASGSKRKGAVRVKSSATEAAAPQPGAWPPEAALKRGLDAAIAQARKGWREGGIPIGSVLLDARGRIVARGHNQRVQSGDPTAHAEVDCIRRAGRRRDWPSLTLVSTLSPCPMCSGTAILFKIPRVVIGENRTFKGAEKWMRREKIALRVMDDARCVELMKRLQREKPDLWAEDIGE